MCTTINKYRIFVVVLIAWHRMYMKEMYVRNWLGPYCTTYFVKEHLFLIVSLLGISNHHGSSIHLCILCQKQLRILRR
jgi:hypothetical protein